MANNGYKVTGYDDFGPLVDFWKIVRKNPEKLAETILNYKKLFIQMGYSKVDGYLVYMINGEVFKY